MGRRREASGGEAIIALGLLLLAIAVGTWSLSGVIDDVSWNSGAFLNVSRSLAFATAAFACHPSFGNRNRLLCGALIVASTADVVALARGGLSAIGAVFEGLEAIGSLWIAVLAVQWWRDDSRGEAGRLRGPMALIAVTAVYWIFASSGQNYGWLWSTSNVVAATGAVLVIVGGWRSRIASAGPAPAK